MRKFGFAAVAIAASLLGAAPAGAAALLTSDAGYTGPILDFGAYSGQFYVFTAGPLSLPGGITYSSESPGSVLGIGGYGLNGNGSSETTNIIGTNDPGAFVTLEFDTAVAMFGGGFNYAADGNGTPLYDAVIMRAFDDADVLIAEYDIGDLAPISTPGAVDAFAFRGIDGGGRLIKRFEFGGSYAILAAQATETGGVPEPGTWVLMILGFGAAGAMLRRRRLAPTAA
ncbi:MAG: PEP-CTERM sorting domain-containing protein [Phenylobacterium sp.]|uniref:PEPxxWA-CTERM sorting domain-containing protein n=1 Tax=Phenylobacterium sp. TaxID=1871053 RepID=UPI001A37D210|nr:PEPxxWA-CTERM sorting domain-containing protein [Phenylobacterium sp.]MBL8773534.1 PEP-CTERM sorting domain-containing protein [Phenylobacterium sp.]